MEEETGTERLSNLPQITEPDDVDLGFNSLSREEMTPVKRCHPFSLRKNLLRISLRKFVLKKS